MTIPITLNYRRLVQVGLASNQINLSTSAAMGHRVQVTMPVDELNSLFYWERVAGNTRAIGRFNSIGFTDFMNASLSGVYSDLDSSNTGLSFSSASLNSAIDRRLRATNDESANDLVMAYILFKCFGSTAATTLDIVYNLEDVYNMITNTTVSNAICASLMEDDAASTSTSPGIVDSMFTHFLAAQPMRFFDASGKQVPYLFETNPDVNGTGSWNLMQGDIIEIPIQFTFTAPVTLNSVRDTDGELSGDTNKSVIIDTNDTFHVRLQIVAGQSSGYVSPTVSTFAGSGSVAGYADGVGTAARFAGPFGSVMDPSDNMYVSEIANHCIRKITPNGTVSTVAGTPAVGGYTNGDAASAAFMNPGGLALDTSGNLYICDIGNNALRMLSPAGIVSTISTTLNGPHFCAVNPSDPSQVYVSDSGNNRVVSVNVSTGEVTTLVSGFLPLGIAYHDGHLYVVQHLATGASPIGINKIPLPPAGVTSSTATPIPLTGTLSGPFGITTMPDGTMYVVDHTASKLYKVMPDGTQTLFAGTGVAGYLDGSVASAQFNLPANVTYDSAGNLYVTGYPSPNIRKISL